MRSTSGQGFDRGGNLTASWPRDEVLARLFDGQSARALSVSLAPSADGLRLEGRDAEGRLRLSWRLDEIRDMRGEAAASGLVLSVVREGDETGRDAARLEVEDWRAVGWLTAHCPRLGARDVSRGVLLRVGLWAGGAVTALALMLFVIIPALADSLARIMPRDREVAFGRAVVSQIARLVADHPEPWCSTPAGDAALARLTHRLLEGHDLQYPVSVRVLRADMLNAFAAPGGQVVVLSGLIEQATSPEMLAGVLAHEFGHVAARDPLRAALRSAGSAGLIGLLVGDFAGAGVLAVVADQLVRAGYTRQAEAAADRFARARLQEAGIDPEPFARFFELLAAKYGEGALPPIFATHPPSAERAALARNAVRQGRPTRPALTPAEWQAIKHICD